MQLGKEEVSLPHGQGLEHIRDQSKIVQNNIKKSSSRIFINIFDTF